jgi:hypothetical protein
LYEGTTAIQGLDFFFRKIVKDRGRAIGLLAKEMGNFAASGGELMQEKAALTKALEDVNAIVAKLIEFTLESQEDPEKIYLAGLNTSRLLIAVGETIIAWLLLRQAEIAIAKSANPGRDGDFYAGKIAAAKFFVATVLPHLSADRVIVEAETGELMSVAEGAF